MRSSALNSSKKGGAYAALQHESDAELASPWQRRAILAGMQGLASVWARLLDRLMLRAGAARGEAPPPRTGRAARRAAAV